MTSYVSQTTMRKRRWWEFWRPRYIREEVKVPLVNGGRGW